MNREKQRIAITKTYGITKVVPSENTAGGLRKIADAESAPCMSPEHNPPMHIVLEPGTYEYVCPACGQKTTFVVPCVWM